MMNTSEKTFVVANETSADNVVYSFAKRGSLSANEMELTGSFSVEVSVLWQNNIVHVAHFDTEKAPTFTLSTTGTVSDSARLIIDESMMPANATELPVVTMRQGRVVAVLAAGSVNEVEINGQNIPLSVLVGDGRAVASRAIAGAHEIELAQGVRTKMQVGSLTVSARMVTRGRKVAGRTRSDRRMLMSATAAALAVAGVLGTVELTHRDDGFLSADVQEDQLADLRAFVNRNAETQPEPVRAETTHEQGSRAVETGTAVQAVNPSPVNRGEHGGNRGHHGGSRESGGGGGGNRDAVARSALAWLSENVEIASMDEAFHNLANGPERGIGPGNNGGPGWPGLNNSGTWGPGGGPDPGNNLLPAGDPRGIPGNRGGCLPGHVCRGGTDTLRLPDPPVTHPQVRYDHSRFDGMDAGLIRRTIQRNRGAIAHCHEQGLQLNPNLSGAVTVAFAIGPDGRVVSSRVASHNLAVPATASCIASAISRMTFPQPPPDVSIVSGTYGFTLTPSAP